MSLVLVVDDDPDLRDALADALEAYGYEVVLASDGQDALEKLAAGPLPAVVLLDVMMPRLGGEAVVNRMRADPALARLPVIAITAGRPPALGVPVLQKPIVMDRLVAELEQAVRA